MPSYNLTAVETRILGCLLEKEHTTPENYPLSLNSLALACNQSTNRDPVVAYDEKTVENGVNTMREKKLATVVFGAGSRVQKYRHNLLDHYTLERKDLAVLCVLLLRGPQTPGELRGRTERMYRFDELSDVQTVLQRLMTREPALVKVLPRQPGTKEPRYAHLLSGDIETFEPVSSSVQASASSYSSSSSTSSSGSQDSELQERMAQLEAEVAILTRELGELRHQFEQLSKLLE